MLPVLYVLGILVLLAAGVVGASMLRAGHQLSDDPAEPGARPAPGHRGVAQLVDGSVRKARVAVADLISTDVHHDDLRPSSAEYSRRGHTYTVFGAGLVGLAAVLLLGLLLVL